MNQGVKQYVVYRRKNRNKVGQGSGVKQYVAIKETLNLTFAVADTDACMVGVVV